ncbi:unnamed protein product [Acanthoscelides obtectus]|uniref:Uncharacterized protein n=1 Tax=Acanthoscelides obtectus TaxID=200917 RepID=A0A9P0KBJ6_ACAOB|nr:unnamed protein product [Acanthoscelides obtectus]CAK1662323.1 hypothetical protein AOBTE_LOCUS23079 [Acanthoscelides obtectus]
MLQPKHTDGPEFSKMKISSLKSKALKNVRARSQLRWWYLHNALAHPSQLTQQFFEKIQVLDHSLCSPDLVPCDFRFFPVGKSQRRSNVIPDLMIDPS